MVAKKKQQGLDRDAALKAVPVKNQLAKVEETKSGAVRILVPVRQTWWTRLMRRLTQAPRYKKIELDEIGTYVWEQCDGQTTVAALIDKLCERFKLSRREGEASLTQYLRELAQRGVIGLAVPAKDADRNS